MFNTVQEAKDKEANATMIYVPPKFAAEAILEAIDSKIELIVVLPKEYLFGYAKVKKELSRSNSMLIGPNCPGIITPEECKIGIMPVTFIKKEQLELSQDREH